MKGTFEFTHHGASLYCALQGGRRNDIEGMVHLSSLEAKLLINVDCHHLTISCHLAVKVKGHPESQQNEAKSLQCSMAYAMVWYHFKRMICSDI